MNIPKHESPTGTLRALKINETIEAPNFQRESFNQARHRLRDLLPKLRFTFKRVDNVKFEILRLA